MYAAYELPLLHLNRTRFSRIGARLWERASQLRTRAAARCCYAAHHCDAARDAIAGVPRAAAAQPTGSWAETSRTKFGKLLRYLCEKLGINCSKLFGVFLRSAKYT
eukprot:6208082-Pleurochrysis_carterae.AAC.4